MLKCAKLRLKGVFFLERKLIYLAERVLNGVKI